MSGTKPNILIVIPSFTQGGSERQAVYYALAIKKAGCFQPILIGLGRTGELTRWMDAEGLAYHAFPGQSFGAGNRLQKLRVLFSFFWFMRRFRPAYILALTYWPTILCGCIWRFTGAKKFWWNQGSVDDGIAFTLWEKLAKWMKPAYLANGKVPAAFISQRHGVPLGEIPIIHNALEIPAEPLPRNQEKLHLLMLANFFPEKDHATVLRAFAQIKSEFSNVFLHLAGAAPGAGTGLLEAKSLAYDLGLCGNVIFHGTVSNPSELLLQAHVGILSTRSEGFSNALMEYMAYGLPVIATDIEANRDALGEENVPWLFPVEDAQKLAELLRLLLKDESRRSAIGRRNYALARERFAMSKFEQSVNFLFLHGIE
jgi:glycosyltransferase involved in cell wall biosynthesis